MSAIETIICHTEIKVNRVYSFGFAQHTLHDFQNTVKPPYFKSRSLESYGIFEMYPKSWQNIHCFAPKIVRLFRGPDNL